MRIIAIPSADWRFPDDDEKVGTPPPKAIIQCPGCQQKQTLRVYEISGDGIVTPSMVCTFAGCSFHDWVRLDGWASESE